MHLDSDTYLAIAEALEDVAMEFANINQLPRATEADKKQIFQSTQIESARLVDITKRYHYELLTPIVTWAHNNVLILKTDSKQLIQHHETGLFSTWIELLAALLQQHDDELSSELKTSLLDNNWKIAIDQQALQPLLDSLENNASPPVEQTYQSSYRLAPDDDVHPELLEAFYLETPDQAIEVAELIRTISLGGANKETHQSAARIAHTIKGSSAVVGLDAVASFAHKLEDILDYSVEQQLPPKTADLLVESSDCLEAMFDSLLTQSQPPQQYPHLLEQLTLWDNKFSSGYIYQPPKIEETSDKKASAINPPETNDKNSHYALAWNKDIHPEILEAYLGETPEHVVEIATLLRDIAKQGKNTKGKRSTELSNACKKSSHLAHSIKGTSATVGISPVANICQPLEEILDYASKNKLPPSLSILLSESANLLESLYDSLLSEGTPPKEYPELYKKLNNWQQHLSAEPLVEKEAIKPIKKDPPKTIDKVKEPQEKTNTDEAKENRKVSLNFRPLEAILPTPSALSPPPVTTPTIQRTHLNETTLRVPVSVIDTLLGFSSELITANTQMANQISELLGERQHINEQNDRIRTLLDELEWTVNQQNTLNAKQATHKTKTNIKPDTLPMDSLEMDSYNELHSITGLLSESIEDDRKMSLSLARQLNRLNVQAQTQKQRNHALNSTVLNMRMESVKILTPRLQRIVRETCRQTKKKAELEIIGEEIALDTDIIKGLVDPLLHLLRNAVDHGIEPANIRTQKSKDKTGKIQLKFTQLGDQITLTLKDDGAGIDAETLYQAAIKKGLINHDEKLSKDEKLRLILLAGLSTRAKVTETSGRGVGMDVVNLAVQNLSGKLSIDSTKDKGSEIRIQVPLTLSAANILLVEVLGNTLAIPNASIQQVYYLSQNSVAQKNEQLFIEFQQKQIPLIALSTLLSWSTSRLIRDKSQSVLIIKHRQQHVALYVDQVLKPLNITIKTLKPWMTNITGVNGVCLLPDGVVAPVLNLFDLLHTSMQRALQAPINITDSTAINVNKHKILVVDDSLSNRTALRLMLEAQGHEVGTAVDGADALRQLEKTPFKLVITDLEMPNMNGLEMVESLRIGAETKNLPIIMVTSRSTTKHRTLAKQAGVDEYLTKPVDSSTLQATIEQVETEKLEKVGK
ncbi:MAG: response regulator [Cocleimonas sp.]|nr:response regulator [Cocleimonas sp.]